MDNSVGQHSVFHRPSTNTIIDRVYNRKADICSVKGSVESFLESKSGFTYTDLIKNVFEAAAEKKNNFSNVLVLQFINFTKI